MRVKPLSRKPDMTPVVYNVPEIAALLDINVISAYELVKRDDFPTVKVGRRIVIPKDAFYAWLEREAAAGK